MVDRQKQKSEFCDYLKKLKNIASWTGHIKNFRVFPAPDAEAFINYSMRLMDIIDDITPYAQHQNSELFQIKTLRNLINEAISNNKEDVGYAYCKDMVKQMNQYIGRIDEWYDKYKGLF